MQSGEFGHGRFLPDPSQIIVTFTLHSLKCRQHPKITAEREETGFHGCIEMI
jgi:hypothetical protein